MEKNKVLLAVAAVVVLAVILAVCNSTGVAVSTLAESAVDTVSNVVR